MKSLRPFRIPLSILELLELHRRTTKELVERALKYMDTIEGIWRTVHEKVDGVELSYGVDGSKFIFENQSLALFAVRALAVAVPLTNGGLRKMRDLDMVISREFGGRITPSVKTNDRAILYMETLEAELTNDLISADAFILADGALSMIAKCRTYEGRTCNCKDEYENIEELALDEYLDQQCKLCLECVHKQKQVSRILSKGPRNLAYVAKKYHSNDIFQDEIFDDLSIIYIATTYLNDSMDAPGATKPFSREIELPLLNQKREVWFFYAKFKSGGNVYYVEVPYPITHNEALNFVANMSKLATRGEGYLVPLIMAHKRVEYAQSKLQNVFKERSPFIRTGREGL